MPDVYHRPTVHPPLGPVEIHVWRVRIDPVPLELTSLTATLSADEVARANRFHFERDRQRYTTGRAALRRLLGHYAGVSPGALTFRYGGREKPEIDQPSEARDIMFNVSHRGDYALYAFTRGRDVGVDIEHLRDVPEALAIARNHFTPAESALLAAAAARGEVRECFFRFWTRKEAVIKAVGTGLSMPLDEFDVSSTTPEGDAWHTVRVPSRPETTWELRDLQPGDGYRGALCVAGGAGEVSFWCEQLD